MMKSKEKKILIIYHSGSGGTKTISEVFKEKLSQFYKVDILQARFDFNYQRLFDYDFFVLGFPTYHCAPSNSMLEFVNKIPEVNPSKNAFVFTTYGLYTGNSLRIFTKKLFQKRIITIGYAQIRGPASDGVLLFPSFISSMFRYEKRAKQKIERFVVEIRKLINSPTSKLKVPHYKWYVLINNLFKYFGETQYNKYRDRLHILEDRCINCNLCVKSCINGCWTEEENHPLFNPTNCEFCLKCVHNCPEKAIVFSDNMKDKPRLNSKFYRNLKQELIK